MGLLRCGSLGVLYCGALVSRAGVVLCVCGGVVIGGRSCRGRVSVGCAGDWDCGGGALGLCGLRLLVCVLFLGVFVVWFSFGLLGVERGLWCECYCARYCGGVLVWAVLSGCCGAVRLGCVDWVVSESLVLYWCLVECALLGVLIVVVFRGERAVGSWERVRALVCARWVLYWWGCVVPLRWALEWVTGERGVLIGFTVGLLLFLWGCAVVRAE